MDKTVLMQTILNREQGNLYIFEYQYGVPGHLTDVFKSSIFAKDIETALKLFYSCRSNTDCMLLSVVASDVSELIVEWQGEE